MYAIWVQIIREKAYNEYIVYYNGWCKAFS